MFNKIFIAYIGLLFTSISHANIVFCNGCSTGQMVQKIKNYTPNSVGIFEMYGADLILNAAKKFKITVTDEGFRDSNGNILYVKIYQEITAESNFQYEIDSASKTTNAVLSSYVNIPGETGLHSASDLIDISFSLDVINDYLSQNNPFTFYGFSFLSGVGGILVGPLSGLELTIKFEDGSRAILIAPELNSAALSFSYKWGTAKDINGNLFPSSPDEYVGKTFRFTSSGGVLSDSYGSFSDRASSFGWTFVTGGGSGTCNSFRYRYFTCSTTEDGSKRCTEQTVEDC